MNVEAYLAASQLWRRRRWLPAWLFPENVTREWDERAEELGQAASVGEARAAALAILDGSGQDFFVRFLQKADLEEARRRDEERSRSGRDTLEMLTGWQIDPKKRLYGLRLACLLLVLVVGLTAYANAAGLQVIATVGLVLSVVFILATWYLATGLSMFMEGVRTGCLGLVANSLIVAGAIGVAVWTWRRGVQVSRDAIVGAVEVTSLALVVAMAVYLNEALPKRRARQLNETVGGIRELIFFTIGFALMLPRFQYYVYGGGAILILVYLVVPYVRREDGWKQGLAFIQSLYAAFLRKPGLGTARAATMKYHGLLKAGEDQAHHTCYGRVWQDEKRPGKTVLQYFYFYAYNDWGNQGGVNFHEGDWEAVFVYLKDDGEGALNPEYVGISQHHAGDARPWHEVELYVDEEGHSHPVIYPAAGSHANYFCSNVGKERPFGKATSGYWTYETADGTHVQERAVTATHRWQGLPLEFPNGLGKIIGAGKPGQSLSLREPESWEMVILENDRPSWPEFRGLWGFKKPLLDESGPTGPKWKRPKSWLRRVQCALMGKRAGLNSAEEEGELAACEDIRLYWRTPLDWLDRALESHHKRSSSGKDPCDSGPGPAFEFVSVGHRPPFEAPLPEAREMFSESEHEAWQKASWDDPESLQAFLTAFPERRYARKALLLMAAHERLAGIRSGSVQPELVIPLEKLGSRWQYWRKKVPEKGVTSYLMTEDGFGAIFDVPGASSVQYDYYSAPITYTGDGSLVIFKTSGLELEYISSIIIQSLEEEALYFGVIEGMGLVHLHGRGRVGIPYE